VQGEITAQTLYLKNKSVCNIVANMPEARAKGFLPKELLSASLFISST